MTGNPYITREDGGWNINPPDMRSVWVSVDPTTASDTVLEGLGAQDQYQAAQAAAEDSSSNSNSSDNGTQTMERDTLDINDDGKVNSGDVQALRSNIAAGGGTDINGDGVVNLADVQALFRKVASVPEDVASDGGNGGGGSGSGSGSPSNFEGALPGPSGNSNDGGGGGGGLLAGSTGLLVGLGAVAVAVLAGGD